MLKDVEVFLLPLMVERRKKITLGSRTGSNRRRARPSFSDALRLAEARARVRANRPANRRRHKSVHASIAGTYHDFDDRPSALLRMGRWLFALLLLPICGVTSWTFFSQFSTVALDHEFWKSTAFWYFATGGLLMTGWFATGLFWNAFLYLYVLGHELTHMIFIWLCRGRISDWGVSVEGGYVTTDKSNIVISLAPSFLPLWASLIVGGYALVGYFVDFPPVALKSLYGLIGFFWAFHMLWTLWMIPRDQPDLRDNGTFLSLMIIYLANLLVLVLLTTVASPEMGFRSFAAGWLANLIELVEAVEITLERFGW
ncbi:MAG: hypothetical protein ACQKBU_12505 [Verrucomicrobiales bacterium]